MILLVENDPLLAETIYLMLELQGYVVSVARDGVDALRQIGWHKPELIVCDWHMPHMNGMELSRRLKYSSEMGSIPFILMSGLIPPAEMKARFDVFLQKPFLQSQLLGAIAQLLPSPPLAARTSPGQGGWA